MSSSFEKVIGTYDISMNECSRVRDRAIDVAFGSKMQHCIGLVLTKYSVRCSAVADIDALECISGIIRDDSKRCWVRCICQPVSIDHRNAVCDQPPTGRGPDEPCPSRNQHAH